MKCGHISAATLSASAALIALGALPHAAHGDWIVGAEANLRHDNNVGNAQLASDIVADTVIGARLSIFQLFPLGETYSVTVGGDLGGESFHRLTGLNNGSIEGVFSLKKKWGLGALAPWARAGVSAGRSNYDDRDRNAWVYRATLASGRRLDARWNFWADYTFERRAARAQEELVPGLSGDAYSQTSHSIGGNMEYSLNERFSLAVGLFGRRGDVVATTAPNATIFYASRALAEDPAFGPYDYAYRLLGSSFGFRAGINYTPTAHSLLGLEFKRLETHAEGGNEYTKSVPQITWDYSF